MENASGDNLTNNVEDVEEMHPWSNLETIATFDQGDNMRSMFCPNNDKNSNNMQIIPVTSSTSALIVSLIHQLCLKVERNKERRNKLYYAICNKMHELELIDNSYNTLEFESQRGEYQRALVQLLKVARATIGNENIINFPPNLSRYAREFREVCHIATGGFGEVFKAINRLDGIEYAIKKILIQPKHLKTGRRQLKEVKTLAKLNHTNIVAYKAAWIEPELFSSFISDESISNNNSIESHTSEDSTETKSSNSQFDENSPDESNTSDNDGNKQNLSCDNVAKSSNDSYIKIKMKQQYTIHDNAHKLTISRSVTKGSFNKLHSSCNIETHIIRKSAEKCVTEDSSDVVSFKYSNSNENVSEATESTSHKESNEMSYSKSVCAYFSTLNKNKFVTLYIQMSLCEQTLKDWMKTRINGTPVPIITAVFEQIIRGLDYIHSQEIVHHDIKPSNIFISTSGVLQIHLGDFGLACPKLKRETHHSGLGTLMYAAPEQIEGKCDPKSDIYSSGIVLTELLISTETQMELINVISHLKEGNISNFVNGRQKWAKLITQLIKQNPVERPCTKQLLDKFYEDKDVTITTLTNNLHEKENQIQMLTQRLAYLEEKCEKMEMSSKNDSIQTDCDTHDFDKTAK